MNSLAKGLKFEGDELLLDLELAIGQSCGCHSRHVKQASIYSRSSNGTALIKEALDEIVRIREALDID
ncbi:hypothetical protein [Spirochaeta dissipatitropha]